MLSIGGLTLSFICKTLLLTGLLLALSWLGLGGNFLGNAIYGVYEALFHIFFA